jgi:PTH1 family peptidyl-tRNA hydrolase
VLIIAGLGNPGPKYAGNRHNSGFMVVEAFAARCEGVSFREKFRGLVARARLSDRDLLLLKPMTFMNLSGESVQQAMQFYKVEPGELVVVHDELDLEFGVLRVKRGGGTAGHKGLASVIEHCGGGDFTRVRLGIGRPRSGSGESWVLSDFSVEERKNLPDVVRSAGDALGCIVQRGVQEAMNRFNSRAPAGDATD